MIAAPKLLNPCANGYLCFGDFDNGSPRGHLKLDQRSLGFFQDHEFRRSRPCSVNRI
jgi:hypothetical protein